MLRGAQKDSLCLASFLRALGDSRFGLQAMDKLAVLGIVALVVGMLCLAVARTLGNVGARRFLTAKGIMWILCGIGCLLAAFQDSASEAAVEAALDTMKTLLAWSQRHSSATPTLTTALPDS